MPQGPIPAQLYTKTPAGTIAPAASDASGNQTVIGAVSAALAVTAAAVVKATPGRFFGVVVVAPGTTSGSLVLNDCATTGAATLTNEIITQIYSGMTAGQVISVPGGFPCVTGLVVSAVPGAGSPQYNILYS